MQAIVFNAPAPVSVPLFAPSGANPFTLAMAQDLPFDGAVQSVEMARRRRRRRR